MPLLDDKNTAIVSDATLENLPDDVQAFILAKQQKRQTLIEALGKSVLEKREAAVKARAASGIETEWLEDEEFYEGIDDANRGENRLVKPNHPSGVVTEKRTKRKNKSSIFMNITRQYVDSAAASVSELGNPTDDRNFSMEPPPRPDVEEHLDNPQPVQAQDANGQPVQATVADFAAQELDAAKKAAQSAQDEIDTYLDACHWHAHQRRAIHDSAKIGTGVLKGPFPQIQKHRRTVKGADGKMAMEIAIENKPASKRIDAWMCYPDPTCGEDIQHGAYFFELDFVNGRQLRDFKQLDGYLADQIDQAMKEGPKKAANGQNENRVNPGYDTVNDMYEVWYYYGLLTREEIEAMGVIDSLKGTDDSEPDPTDAKALQKINELEACPCIVTMVNDVPIKACLNPLDSGEFPYDFFVWETRDGQPWGRGVSRIMRAAQRVVNGGIRNMMDNAKLSGGVQVGVKKGAIKPMGGGEWRLDNITFWEMQDDDARTINDVLSFHQVPSVQKELLNIIQFGQKMAEDVTGMPLLLQGQTGDAPDTVGGMQMLNKNATATRRMIARRVDDDFTTPHIRRYYEWILMYGAEESKGDFNVVAKGSQSLVEKDIERQYSIQMLANALQPQYGVDPYKAMSNALRAEMIDPAGWQLDERTYQQNMAKLAQTASNPTVQAAQVRAQAQIQSANIHEQGVIAAAQEHAKGAIQATQLRTERDAQYDQIEMQKMANDRQAHLEELQIQRELALLQYANQRNINLDAVKGELAQTTMKLQTEKELAATATQLDAAEHVSGQAHEANQTAEQQAHERATQAAQHAHETNVANLHPEVQVPGRAGNGNALNQMP